MRQWLAIGAAVIVLIAAVGGAYWWLDQQLLAEDESGDDPAATVAAYAEAWSTGDHDAMAELVRDPPDGFAEIHDQLREGLELDELVVQAGPVREDVDGRATTVLTVEAVVPAIGTITWESPLRVLRERGRWGVAWEPGTLHPEWRPGLHFARVVTTVDRAPILAADGTPLADVGRRVTFGFEPTAVDDPDALVERFDEAIPGSGSTAARLLAGTLVDGWFYPVVSVSEERADDAAPVLRGVGGVLRRTDEGARSLLREDFAVHVVGRVGDVTAEQLDELGPPYEAGDRVGQFGLERIFERDLVGGEAVAALLRDGPTGPTRVTLAEQDPSSPLRTTIDVTVQTAIENALIGTTEAAAIVVVDGTDGAVVGSASRPLDGFNRAFEGRYRPGTVFGIVTVEAAFADGIGATDEVTCADETSVGGVRVVTTEGTPLGTTTLEEAFAAACETTFAELGAQLGGQALSEAAERFGFGTSPGTPLPAFGGSFPAPADTAEAGTAAAGTARVEASPLHLAAVAAAAVTGSWHPPYLLDDDGPGTARRLTSGAADDLDALLRAAIADGPSAAAAVGGQPPFRGLTGTAPAAEGGSHAWFVGAYGDLGVAVLVEDGGLGADAAAPLAARFARELRALEDEPPGATDDADD